MRRSTLLLFLLLLAALPARAQITVTTTADEYGATDDGACSLREAIALINGDATARGCTGSGPLVDLPAGTYRLTRDPAGEFATSLTLSDGDLDVTGDLTLRGAGANVTFVQPDGFSHRLFHLSGTFGTPITVTLQGLTLRNGTEAGDAFDTNSRGGGAYIGPYTSFTLQDCAIRDNTAGGARGLGAGLYVDNTSGTIQRCELSGNSAATAGTDQGGGLYLSSTGGTNTIDLYNSTLSGNTADEGAGLFLQRNSGTATVSFFQSTITANTGGGVFRATGTITMQGTIVGAPTSGVACRTRFGSSAGIISQGYNIDAGTSCEFSGTGDQSATDPQLGALADNGGPTRTHLPALASPAVDKSSCDAATVGTTDQRGEARETDDPGIVDAHDGCDVGAAELASAEMPVELTRFEAVVDGDDAALAWGTASETDNAGFEVQRRADDGQWVVLGWIAGAGTTLQAQQYAFRAERLTPGRHVFRLRQVDFDGAFEYSPEREAVIGVAGTHHLSGAFPNPFNPATRITLTVAATQQVSVAVYDVQGRRVARLYDGQAAAGERLSLSFGAAALPSGTYVVRAVGERFEATRLVQLLK